jgi:putative Ig domain-containing protein
MQARVHLLLALVGSALASACSGMTQAAAGSVAVAVTPHDATVAPGGTIFFAALVTTSNAAASRGVIWSVKEPGGGTVDGSGTYTAPAAPGVYHVTVASMADSSATDTSSVTVSAASGISVGVVPRNASATPGSALAFSATVTGAAAAQSTSVTWSVQEAAGGTVDASGHYTAPSSTGTFHVVATSVADTSKAASATVTVTAAPVLTVSISPASASAVSLGTVQFSATVTGASAGQSTAVTWSVQEAGGGTVTSAGKYTAPAGAGTFHVVATSVADAAKKDSAVVTVSSAPALSITTTSLPDATAGMAYSASLGATGGSAPYTWAAIAGSLPAGLSLSPSTGGISGAPAAAGPSSFTVEVTDAALRKATAALSINVGAPSAIDESILPEMYRTVWDPGIPGGIPADDDPVRPATVWLPAGNPYGGYSVNPALTGSANAAAFTAAFQAAINAAGAAATPSSRRIVLLKAGTYFVNPQLNSGGQVGIYVKVDNVTLRGEGADTTRLAANGTINDYGTVVLFGHRTGSSDASFAVQNVTADALRGSRTVQVANASVYAVGDVITIDHLDGPAVATGSAMINGGYIWFYDGQYFKRQPAYEWSGPSTGAGGIGNVTDLASANAAAQSVVPQWRSTMQETEIAAISGNVLTLKDPLNIDFPLSTSPQVWRTVPIDTGAVPVGNRWSGIENIAVAGGNNNWGFPGGTVAFSYMAYAWAKNIEADGAKWTPFNPAHPGKYGYNIGIGRSYRVVVRDSFAHGSADENPGGQAYGIVVGVGSSNCLVENNISVDNNKPVALNSTGGGNVIAYNYVDEAVLWNSPGWQENAIDDCHANFTHHDLIEGNWTPNLGGDTTHGNSGWHTHLRNYANGRNSSGSATANLRAVGMDGWTHYHAYVGNVLKGGTVYQTTPTSRSGTPIFQLGNFWGGMSGNWDNGYALAHIYRDGNWDSVSKSVVWATTARAIPNSFYLTGKPSFFGANAWPWVDPIAGTTSTLPAKARYDAGTPNTVP